MSDAYDEVKSIGKGIAKVAGPLLGASFGYLLGGPLGAVAGAGIGKKATSAFINITDPPNVEKIGGPPTIDDAARNQQVTDRIRARRGVLSNIYGGGSTSGQPTATGTKSLLGS